MPITLDQNIVLSVGDEDVLSIDCTLYLDSGETVSSATIAEVTTADLALGACVVNVATKVIRGKTVAIGAAISATVSGQLEANSPYNVLVTLTTSASRKRAFNCKFTVE